MTSRVLGVESLTALTEMIFFLPVRVRQRLRSRADYKARAKAIDATRRRLEGVAAERHRAVLNAGLYLLHLDQDLADFTDALVYSLSERRRTFIARHAAAALLEAVESIPQVLGPPFRDTVSSLGLPEALRQRLEVAWLDLNRFGQSEGEFLTPIRQAAAARRGCDALSHIEALERVKPPEVKARVAELSRRLRALLAVVSEITLTAPSDGVEA